jgi:prepilin-type N-terminal cleavage/methylation domain-containing protein
MDNNKIMNTQGNHHNRSRLAFTLIELLTVMAIMGIVVTMVVTMGQAASQRKKIVTVEGDKNKLITMIESYHTKLNYYPPDNGLLVSISNNPILYDAVAATNPLIYELTGATNFNDGTYAGTIAVFNSSSLANTLSVSSYSNVFNRGGVANGDASEPRNFFQPGPAAKEYASYTNTSPSSPPVCGLIVPVDLNPGNLTNGNFNWWHYDSSTTNRHNMNSYDLWAEFSIGSKNGKLTIITNGNW